MFDTVKDSLFSNRFEERFLIESDKIYEVVKNLNLSKDESQSQWVTTVYVNNNDHSLPTGTAVRFRTYSDSEQSIILDNREGFVEYNSLLYNKKLKTRKVSSLPEIIEELNNTYINRYSDFKAKFAIIYKREVYSKIGTRLTIDYPVQSYRIDGVISFDIVQRNNFAQVEIKQDDFNHVYSTIIKKFGGIPTIPKYYSLYNFEYSENAEKKYQNYFDDSNGFEYEKKLTLDSEDIFTKYVVSIHNNQIIGYKVLRDFPDPFCFTSLNEYRKTVKDSKNVCIMYTGDEVQRVHIKDTGEILDGNILKRKKTEYLLKKNAWEKLVDEKILGLSLRIKKIFFIQSCKTGIIYGVIMDKSQKPGGQLYQMEIEYAMSTKPYVNDLETHIIEEIEDIASYFKLNGSIDTLVKKTDWINDLPS